MDPPRMGDWPRWTVGIAAAEVLAYAALLELVPPTCHGDPFPGLCAEVALRARAADLALLTMPFLHGSWSHLLGNLVLFVVFGTATERWHGPRTLLWIFVVGGYLSTAVQAAANLAANQPPLTVGISGAVYGLGTFLGVTLFPASRDHFDALVADPEGSPGSAARPSILVGGALFSAYAFSTHVGLLPADPRSATLSHLVGAAFGVATGLYLRARE